MSDPRDPDLADLLIAGMNRREASRYFAEPARVERYDEPLGLVDALVLNQQAYTDEQGARRVETLPVITNVPLVFQGSGELRVTFPISVGDTVLLVFASSCLDAWLSRGTVVDPGDDRRGHLSDAIAIPGLRPAKAHGSRPAGVLALGKDGGPWQSAALGDRLNDYIAQQRAFNAAHTHAYTWTGSPGAGSTAAAADSTSPVDVRSGTVKVSE